MISIELLKITLLSKEDNSRQKPQIKIRYCAEKDGSKWNCCEFTDLLLLSNTRN